MPPRPLLPDDPRLIGRWEIRARLGAGGFGTVYEAVGPGDHRGAVKTMHPHLAREDEFLTRFGREIALAKRVQGEHVARVLDYDLRGDPPFLVTEFVEGPTLHDAVEENGPLEGENLYALALALAEGVASVTDAGVIHRDLKPANVILTERTPVLVDFGIASAAGLSRITSTGTVVGTGPYMAPEQFTGLGADHRVDVFAWASVVCFAANGVPPFATEEGNPTAVMYKVLHTEPDHGALTGRLRELVARAHAKDPAERPAIRALVDALVTQAIPDTAVIVEDEGTATEIVEQTWHLTEALERTVPPTEVRPPPEPTPTPARPEVPASPYPQVVYTPPRAETGPVAPLPPPPQRIGPAPQGYPPPPPGYPPQGYAPPPQGHPPQGQPPPPGADGKVRYRGDHLALWVSKLPNFGKLATVAAGVYVGFGLKFDEVNDGIPITSVNQADLDDAFDAAWSFLPLVVFLVVAYVGLRIVRIVGRSRGFTTAGWRGYAAAASAVGVGLALIPSLATVVLAYGPGVLEPNDRIDQNLAIISGSVGIAMAILAVVGLVYAIRATINFFRALVGRVTL